MALHQFGFSSAVATLGTALTPEHVRLLGRYTQNIVALFDGDDAGRKAAARSFEIFVETGLLGRAAFLPAGEDPDTFVHSHGPDALEKILGQAIPLADYYFSWLKQRFGMSLEGKSQIASEVSRLLAKLSKPIEVDLLVQRAVDTLGIREELLRRAPDAGYRPGAKTTVHASSEKPSQSRDDIAEQSLVCLMLRGSSILRAVDKEREMRQWLSPKWRDIIDLILAEWQERGEVDVFRVAQKANPDSAGQITALALQGESIPEIECDRMAADCFSHLRRKYLRTLERDLRLAIRAAENGKTSYEKSAS
jgi:DNA primase